MRSRGLDPFLTCTAFDAARQRSHDLRSGRVKQRVGGVPAQLRLTQDLVRIVRVPHIGQQDERELAALAIGRRLDQHRANLVPQ